MNNIYREELPSNGSSEKKKPLGAIYFTSSWTWTFQNLIPLPKESNYMDLKIKAQFIQVIILVERWKTYTQYKKDSLKIE